MTARYYLAHPFDAVLDRAGLTIDWPLARRSFHHLGWAGITDDYPFPKDEAPNLTALRGVKPFAFLHDWNSTAGFGTVFLSEPLYDAATQILDDTLTRITRIDLSFGKKTLPYVIDKPAPDCEMIERIDFAKSRFFSCDFDDYHRFGTRCLRGRNLGGKVPPVTGTDLTFADRSALEDLRRNARKSDVGAIFRPLRLTLSGNGIPGLLCDGTDLYVREDIAECVLTTARMDTPGMGFPYPGIEVSTGS